VPREIKCVQCEWCGAEYHAMPQGFYDHVSEALRPENEYEELLILCRHHEEFCEKNPNRKKQYFCFCGNSPRKFRGCTTTQLMIGHCADYMYDRVPYGSEQLMAAFTRQPTCPECGVDLGGFHHNGCDLEECPKCHKPRKTCRCDYCPRCGESWGRCHCHDYD
jgi:hypothetical protein